MDFCILIVEFDNIEKYIGLYYLFTYCAYISCFVISEQGTLSYAAMFLSFYEALNATRNTFISKQIAVDKKASMHSVVATVA